MNDWPSPIGITGRATAGKDSIGAILVEEYGYTRVAFADALKSMALVLDPWIVDGAPREVDNEAAVYRLSTLVGEGGWEDAKKLPEVRRFLQVLGTEAVREHIGENAWVDAAYKTMVGLGWEEGIGLLIVITDVRFPNEADFVKSLDGEMWRVLRDVPKLDHASEVHVDTLPVDLELDNNGPKEELRLHVAAALGGYLDDPVPWMEAEYGENTEWLEVNLMDDAMRTDVEYAHEQDEGREADRW